VSVSVTRDSRFPPEQADEGPCVMRAIREDMMSFEGYHDTRSDAG